MAETAPGYWAFLSYCHEDARWAARLHHALERFAIPRRLIGEPTPAGPAPAHFRPIFRDRDELGASADLGGRLTAALKASAYLIVICSPAAARSRWVNEEIVQFRTAHGDDRILAVIVAGRPLASLEGEPEAECFPPALLPGAPHAQGGLHRVEPIAADLRADRDGFRLALLKLASGMLGVGLDHLVQRDARRRQQRLLTLTGASFAASAVLGALAIAAVIERNEAVAQRRQAEGLIEFMIGDLRNRLEPIGGLDALNAVGDRALAYYAAQQAHGMDAQSLGRRARVLHMLGEIRDRRGDLAGALALFQQAAASTGELLARRPNDAQRVFDHAQSVYWVGYVAYRRGHDADARRAFVTYQALANRLVQIDPANQDWWNEVVYANSNLGTVLLQDGKAEQAEAAFQRALAESLRLAAAAPTDSGRQMDLGQSEAWLADAEFLRGEVDRAEQQREAERAVYLRLIAQNPSNNDARLALDVNRTAMARISLAHGRTTDALGGLEAARTDMERLIAGSPQDQSYQLKAAPTLLLLARLRLQTGDLDGAEQVVNRVRAMGAVAVRKDPTAVAWVGEALGGAHVLGMKIAAARAATASAQADALAPAIGEASRLATLVAARPDNVDLARVAAEAELLAGDATSLGGSAMRARAYWAEGERVLGASGLPGRPPGDASALLLRQLGYRLQLSRAPYGLSADLSGRRASGGRGGLIDYQW